jgi:hypothetical protein
MANSHADPAEGSHPSALVCQIGGERFVMPVEQVDIFDAAKSALGASDEIDGATAGGRLATEICCSAL